MTLTITSTQGADVAAPEPGLDDRIHIPDHGTKTSAERLVTSFGPSAQKLFAGLGRSATISSVIDLALPTFRCAGVGVTLLDTASEPQAAGASDDDAAATDRLQLSLHQGPVLQAIERCQPVVATELRSDGRWRFWAPLAADLGYRSVLALPLADGDIAGALTLYSRSVSRFSSADLAPAMAFAQLASIAVAVAQEREQLLLALLSRGIVGQAQGILMGLYGVTAAQALTVVHRYASQHDLTTKVMAEIVIRDRGLPDSGSRRPSPALRV